MSDMSCVGCVVCHSVSKFVVMSNHVPLVQILRLLQDGSVLVNKHIPTGTTLVRNVFTQQCIFLYKHKTNIQDINE